jgi:hypothetical protein
MIVGLTGLRYHGKSTVAQILGRLYGYKIGHSFAPGKAMAKAYFMYCGVSEEDAERMINGDLKDVESEYLPNAGPFSKCPTQGTPRFFMEMLGKAMPTMMGQEWTIGAVLNRLTSGAKAIDEIVNGTGPNIVFESVVYEAEFLKAQGVPIIRIYNPNPPQIVEGLQSDEAVRNIDTDYLIHNDGTLQDLESRVRYLFEGKFNINFKHNTHR